MSDKLNNDIKDEDYCHYSDLPSPMAYDQSNKNLDMTIDELREIINKLDNRPNGGINYIALFSDHSGFIYENMYGTKLGEFNNPEEMIELVNKLMNE